MSGIFMCMKNVKQDVLHTDTPKFESPEYILSETRKFFGGNGKHEYLEKKIKIGTSSEILLISSNLIVQNEDSCRLLVSHGLENREQVNLFGRMSSCSTTKDFEDVLTEIKGPFSLFYIDISIPIVVVSKDPMGRKSMLFQYNNRTNHLYFSSMATYPEQNEEEQEGEEEEKLKQPSWSELGIENVYFLTSSPGSPLNDWNLRTSNWEEIHQERSKYYPLQTLRTDSLLFRKELTQIEQKRYEEELFQLLYNSVERKILNDSEGSIAIMFSGGIDSFSIAVLSCIVITKRMESGGDEIVIELFNVNFGDKISSDRKQAIQGYSNLKNRFPQLPIKLILINRKTEDLDTSKDIVKRLMYPRNTVLDYNISSALFHASCGKGVEYSEEENDYESTSTLYFSGLGADELFAGYGRHKTSFLRGYDEDTEFSDLRNWRRLNEELGKDIKRLWLRNFARDDRLMSLRRKFGEDSNFKEIKVKYPFLDEPIMELMYTEIPLNAICDLRKEKGVGDKLILRNIVKSIMKFEDESKAPKRAIQFGSNISKISYRKKKGSDVI